jgi:hypothetical protein
MTGFRWNDWNLEHATKHACKVSEIEAVVLDGMRRHAVDEEPDGTFHVEGRGLGGRVIEVTFVFDAPDASVMYDQTVYVIHAQPLTTRRRKGKRR